MKLLESSEVYLYECCDYFIRIRDGEALVESGFLRTIKRAKYCPGCGKLIPHVCEQPKVLVSEGKSEGPE